MTLVPHPLQETLTSGDLLAEIRSRTPDNGGNSGGWPGLTFYRYTQPTAPQWEEVKSLSLCVIAQGRKCVVSSGQPHYYDPLNYLVLSSSQHFTAEIIEATAEKPFLSLVLQIDPTLVRRVSSDILDRRAVPFGPKLGGKPEPAFVSPLDSALMSATIRFLQATHVGADRRVLAPLYLREMVYRVLQAEQYERLIAIAASEVVGNPVSDVIAYVQHNMSDPLTVSDMAERVSMSPSAFSHLFREVTGKSPYQFVKEMRLNRARDLLIEQQMSVTKVSRTVGYSSTSHFINEFRDRFGATPRAYCNLRLISEELGSQQQG
ncbi:AraC family transcriptional regulator [Streptomyces sp. NPDC093018]|uniref:AraC family transcriptional regulator n=1 Tax=Streptomyces sp. NPDC093018 TaxID=3155067 RepID=UPI003436CA38